MGGVVSYRYQDPTAGERKVVFYDPTGKTLPTAQTWVEKVTSLGDDCWRMEFAWGPQHSLRVPGICNAGNFITQGLGPGGIELSCNTNLTFRDIRQEPSSRLACTTWPSSAANIIIQQERGMASLEEYN